MSTTAAYPQSACLLFSLPAELRNEIYHHVLCIPAALTWNYAPRLRHDSTRATPKPRDNGILKRGRVHPSPGGETVLAVLQTCRLVNQEAAGIFYNTHEWYLEDKAFIPAPVNWFSVSQPHQDLVYTLSTPRLAGFHSLTVEISSVESLVKVAGSLTHLPNLRSLKFLIKAEVVTAKWASQEMLAVFREIEALENLEKLEVTLLADGDRLENLRVREKLERRVERMGMYLGQAVRCDGDGGNEEMEEGEDTSESEVEDKEMDDDGMDETEG